jgi:acetylornithine deacetylase/succinyl-diaminopimelate desuccinylase-like protein
MPEKVIPARSLSVDEQALLDSVDAHREDLIELVMQLVAQDSTTEDPAIFSDVSAIFSVVKGYLEGMGANCELFQCPHAENDDAHWWPNLVGTLGPSDPGLQLCGHLDVVPAGEGWSTPPFEPVVKDGKIYGRGTADMKGGVAAILYAGKLLADSHHVLGRGLRFLFTPDEELDCAHGSGFMAREHADAIASPLTIIGEPTCQPPVESPVIIVGEKGYAWLRAKFFGAGGHGSMPKPKSNPVNKLARFIEKSTKDLKLPNVKPPLGLFDLLKAVLKRMSLGNLIKTLRAPAAGSKDPYDEDGVPIGNLFKPVISFTRLSAGTKINVIPKSADIEFDIRVLPGITPQDVLDSLASYCTKLGYRATFPPGFTNPQDGDKKVSSRPVDVEFSIISAEASVYTSPDLPLIGDLARAFEDVYHVRAVYFFAPGSTDATYLHKGGLKNITVFGPGGGNEHDANEFLSVDKLVNACKVYLLLAYRLICNPNST